MDTPPIIKTEDLTVTFGGNTAVNQVSLDVKPNIFLSIIGPNGAGKTTFFNLISGQYQSTSGRILFRGHDITRKDVADRAKMGMGRSFQLTAYYPHLTVLQNVCLAVQQVHEKSWVFWKPTRDFEEIEDEAYAILQSVMLDKKWSRVANTISHGEQRKLEIAVLLAMQPEVMLLDEPTAGMAIEEVPTVLDLLEELKDQHNRTMILVEHKMDMILRFSDEIAVLQEGRLIAHDVPDAIMDNKQVQAAYLGKAYED